MSRIGKKPITIPSGVKIEVTAEVVKVSGPKGSLQLKRHPKINVKLEDDGKKIVVENTAPDSRAEKAVHGTTRALLNNMVAGVNKGFDEVPRVLDHQMDVEEEPAVFPAGSAR